MTRGEMQDLLEKFAATNSAYRSALIKNPKSVIEKQFNMTVPDNVTIKAVEENANTIYVIVPHAVAAGATVAPHQPPDRDESRLRVMLDPAGHPFCLFVAGE